MTTTWIAEYAGGAMLQYSDSENPPDRGTPVRVAQTPRIGLPSEVWDWDAQVWVVDVERRRGEALLHIDYERFRAYAALPTSPLDREYDQKADEARQLEGPRVYIEAEAAARGITVGEVCAIVLANAAAANAPRARIAGIAVSAKAAIRAAPSVSAIDAIITQALADFAGETL